MILAVGTHRTSHCPFDARSDSCHSSKYGMPPLIECDSESANAWCVSERIPNIPWSNVRVGRLLGPIWTEPSLPITVCFELQVA